MAEIRGASLAAHAAARKAKKSDAARFAARAAGQAAATAHVPQHALGTAYYALKAIAAADPAKAEFRTARERDWQSRHLGPNLRREMLKWLMIEKRGRRIFIWIKKGPGF